MGGAQKFPRLLGSLIGIATTSAVTWGVLAGGAAAAESAWRARVSPRLLAVYDGISGAQVAELAPRLDVKGQVQVDVHYDCSLEAPTGSLTAAGLSPGASVRLGPLCVVEGWVGAASLAQVASVAGVTRVEVPSYAIHRGPRTLASRQGAKSTLRPRPSIALNPRSAAGSSVSIDHNGALIMRADQFVAQTGVTGAGVMVGVQSTGVASISVIESRHELPTVKVVSPAGGSANASADEGTALLEEVYAVAPGAGLAFCEPDTFVGYTSCLGQLVKAGATILVDDVVFTQGDLLTSDNTNIQAIEQFLAQNPTVAMFTAVGNYDGSYWEGMYTPVLGSSVGLAPMTCPANGTTQTDTYFTEFDGSSNQTLTVSQGENFPVTFAWSDPPGHNSSKFDLYWVGTVNSASDGCLSYAAATDNHATHSLSLPAANYRLYIGTPDNSAAGKFLKLWFGGDGVTSISDPKGGSVITPQAFAQGVVSIGAVNGSDAVGNTIESFSSTGPITVSFPTTGTLQAPILVAPDGISVDATGTYFASYLFPDGNFYGTSASAPNAGAVAALILSAFPALSVSQVVTALQKGATQLGASAPDGTFGYGRVDALGALATFAGPTMTSIPDSSLAAATSSQAFPFTVSGTGKLHFTVTSSNTSLIPASVVAAGTPGVTISPSDCGATTLSCTATITVGNGPSDTVSLTISALDGANRAAPTSLKVTIAGNQAAPPPSAPSTPSTASGAPTGGGGGGGLLQDWELAVLATVVLLTGWRRYYAPESIPR
jgi:hypothetical protein